MKNLDIQDDRGLIISRVLMATTAETFTKDIQPLETLYSKVQIVKELRKTRERVSNEVCKLVARRDHVKQFLRYQ